MFQRRYCSEPKRHSKRHRKGTSIKYVHTVHCVCVVVYLYCSVSVLSTIVVRMELLKKRARLFLFFMFSARKKQKKEVPQWKLDIAEGSGAVDDGSDDLPPLPPTPPRAPPTPPEAPSDAAGAAGSAEEAKAEDDDDDDDVDLSKYELGSEEGGMVLVRTHIGLRGSSEFASWTCASEGGARNDEGASVGSGTSRMQ